MIVAFPSYTKLLCINEEIYIFLLQSTSQPVSLSEPKSVHFKVALIRLHRESISGSFENV